MRQTIIFTLQYYLALLYSDLFFVLHRSISKVQVPFHQDKTKNVPFYFFQNIILDIIIGYYIIIEIFITVIQFESVKQCYFNIIIYI